jgi:hypothetical protein
VNLEPRVARLEQLVLVSGLSVPYGGTGITSYAIGDMLYASAATTLSKLAGVATGNALISGGVATAPSWGKVGLTTHVSGTLGVGNGGTGATTLTGYVKGNGAGAFTAQAVPIPATDGGTGQSTYAVGDLLYGTAANTLSKLADVATGNALISGGVGVAPSWGKIALTTHVSGTLGAGNGGTDKTSLGYTSFTPTLTGVTIGNGTWSAGSQWSLGKLFIYAWRFTFGTTSAVTGHVTATHPANVISGMTPIITFAHYRDVSGSISVFGNGLQISAPGTVDLYAEVSSTSYVQRASLSSTVPFTWANTDYIEVAVVGLLF